MADEERAFEAQDTPEGPDCDCEVTLDELPDCNDEAIAAILCAVAHEQTEMARMLKVLRCKLCKTVAWLPNEIEDEQLAVETAIRIETDVADLIRAMAEKEEAIANKVKATMGLQG